MDSFQLIPAFGGVAWTIAAFILALSIIVFVHEYGHYIVGRWSGIHAEVFSVGFGKVLWSKVDKRGTKWQIAAVPLGGYVKFLGDSNAASGKDGTTISKLSPEERRHTMHGAPLWARAATVAAGPAFNFVMAALIFSGVSLAIGVPTDRPVVQSVSDLPFKGDLLQPGDQILSVAGVETKDLVSFVAEVEKLPPLPSITYVIARDGKEITIEGPHPMPPRVSMVNPLTAANAAGIRKDDVVLSIDGTPLNSFSEIRDIVDASAGKPLEIKLWRAGDIVDVTLSPKRTDLQNSDGTFETRYLIGVTGELFFKTETRTPGVFEALKLGTVGTYNVLANSLSGLGHIITGAISTCNVRGAIGIAQTSGAAANNGLLTFILFIASLSTAVGMLNLFPIPVLDGGHLVFHAYEAVARRPPNEKIFGLLMSAGFVLVISFMIFGLTNDLFCP